MEVISAASRLGIAVEEWMAAAKEAGLDSTPGTAAEILDEEIRWILTKGKLPASGWIRVVSTAHRLGDVRNGEEVAAAIATAVDLFGALGVMGVRDRIVHRGHWRTLHVVERAGTELVPAVRDGSAVVVEPGDPSRVRKARRPDQGASTLKPSKPVPVLPRPRSRSCSTDELTKLLDKPLGLGAGLLVSSVRPPVARSRSRRTISVRSTGCSGTSMIDAGAVRCVPVEHLLGEVVDMRRTQDQGAGAGASVGVLLGEPWPRSSHSRGNGRR
jgi:hypothetical protein